MIANTPSPPYYAVIFTSLRSSIEEGYEGTAHQMVALAAREPGFLGVESARDGLGITVSYWESLEAIRHWKENLDHQMAQKLGQEKWYSAYKTRVCKVERDYGWPL
jgi:heme-degrading monooxygenase HmoA